MNIDHVGGMVVVDISDGVIDEVAYEIPKDSDGYIVKDVDGDLEFANYFDTVKYIFNKYGDYERIIAARNAGKIGKISWESDIENIMGDDVEVYNAEYKGYHIKVYAVLGLYKKSEVWDYIIQNDEKGVYYDSLAEQHGKHYFRTAEEAKRRAISTLITLLENE